MVGENQISAVRLRAATQADQALIRTMVRAAGLNRFGLAWRNFLVAEAADVEPPRVVGIGQLRPHRDGSLELASLLVVEEMRGTGVGRLLVDALLHKAARSVFLICSSEKVPYYLRFDFYEVTSPADVPQTVRGLFRVAAWVTRLLAHFSTELPRLAIMRHDGLR